MFVTSFITPPGPIKPFWQAVSQDYDGGDPIGRGATVEEAIDDLVWQLEDLGVLPV